LPKAYCSIRQHFWFDASTDRYLPNLGQHDDV
jgi:hypothetical protein